jgi:hypothetical protein
MRHTFLIFTIVYSTALFAQEADPDLFQTWYLQSVFASDATPEPYIVSEIEPPINPTLTIQSDLTFSATAACNLLPGSFASINEETFETNAVGTSFALCGYDVHEAFEIEYREFLNIMTFYSISSNENGMTLTIGTPIFGEAIFNNFPLSLTEPTIAAFEVFPNPSNSVIHINSKDKIILSIELFSSIGERVEVVSDNFDTIDISHLSKGLYYLKVHTESGTVMKRVLRE